MPYRPTVDLVKFAQFLFSGGGQIRKVKNLAKIIIIIALLEKEENSRILKFLKSSKIGNYQIYCTVHLPMFEQSSTRITSFKSSGGDLSRISTRYSKVHYTIL